MKSLGYEQDLSGGKYEGEYFCDKEFLTVTPLLFRLGFKLKLTAKGYMPLEKMINLEALNEFVLTGKTKEAEIQKALAEQSV